MKGCCRRADWHLGCGATNACVAAKQRNARSVTNKLRDIFLVVAVLSGGDRFRFVEVENDLIFLSKKRPVLTEAIEEIVAFAEASSAVIVRQGKEHLEISCLR